ncbi:hypothetical protein [Dyadobacter sandarakinus]|uniref:Uncharacterized protein n=1 Tax=Dyadobacter sandarakinus TaxID=2747268 RepID=A0ABX7I2F2_9BACT|nr:hypothetical protein [Dyadobacter sandarakinus]QRQ99721.1 hypothetical protein HWI92_01715 [Dyadobacter sandarakinus]
MSNYWLIYWITRLDNIQGAFAFAAFASLAAALFLFMSFMVGLDYDSESEIETKNKWRKSFLIAGVIFGAIAVVIPSKNDAIMIAAGGKAMDFVEQDSSLSKLPKQTTLFITKYLDGKIADMEKEDQK